MSDNKKMIKRFIEVAREGDEILIVTNHDVIPRTLSLKGDALKWMINKLEHAEAMLKEGE